MEGRDKYGSGKKTLVVFLILWSILNLLQSYFTELGHDEAYYWTWSKHLDWGFIEHPPMVALFIKLGFFIFHNELGVRLLSVLFSSLILYLIYDKLVRKDVWLYILMISSILIFHLGGFMAAPDTPLMLFVGLYYLLLKQYLKSDDWRIVLGMILVVTAMMYSKYHGILVIFFTILFNFKLLVRKSFWLITVTSLLLYIPHLYWLFSKGRPGLEYAISGRFSDPFSFYQVIGNFLGGQLAMAGPIIGVIVFYAAFVKKPRDKYERIIKYVMLGIIGYFFIWSFKGRTEANWTASAYIPLLVLSHAYISERYRLRKIVLWLSVPSIAFLLLARMQIAFQVFDLPHSLDRNGEYHGWPEYAKKVSELAQGKMVVSNGYHTPSKLWFYSGNLAISTGMRHHPNQYQLWNYENDSLDRPVLMIGKYLHGNADKIKAINDTLRYKFIEEYRSYREVEIIPQLNTTDFNAGDTVTIDILIKPPSRWAIPAKASTKNPVYLSCHIRQGDEWIMWNGAQQFIETEIAKETIFPFKLPAPDKAGEGELIFAFSAYDFMTWETADAIEITISD